MAKLHGKVAIVSGSGRGIGRAIALKLACEGAKVVVNDLHEAAANSTVEAICAQGGEAVSCIGNVCALDFAVRFVRTALDRFDAKEWGRLKVCVNCVAFGFIETRLTKPIDDPETRIEIEGRQIQTGIPAAMLDALKDMVPLGRAGSPEEAAGSVYLLCVPESDYVSGEVLVVGGGLSI